jgi:transposase-like protein
VPVVARRHCVNANQLFMWRSQYRRGELVARAERERPATLVPVQIQPSAPEDAPPQERRLSPLGFIHIEDHVERILERRTRDTKNDRQEPWINCTPTKRDLA